jgi:hypothetical protein
MTKKHILLWVAFVALSALSLVVEQTMWMFEWQGLLQFCAFAACLALGVLIVMQSRRKLLSAIMVAIALFIGQWWFFGMLIAFALWSINGFAP